MTRKILVGSRVKLLLIPDWLVHDLPESERREMRSFVGQTAMVKEIDAHGYIWIGFGSTESNEDAERYSGHSFGVLPDCLQLVE